jgi:hypothetical protein
LSGGGATRYSPGRSGNLAGRPKARRPHISAFDVIFDQTLTVTQGGKPRELTIDEALELQTYQAALGGSKLAIRKVLKMIEKREAALAKRSSAGGYIPPTLEFHHDADNANEAMRILDIIERDPAWGDANPREKVTHWAGQAALSRSGSRELRPADVNNIKLFVTGSEKLKWPRGRSVG